MVEEVRADWHSAPRKASMHIVRHLFLVATLVLAGCVAQNPDLPTFASIENTLPAPAPGTARLYFYRLLEPYDIPSGTTVYLNGNAVGYLRNGAVMYRDVKPGSYFVSVASPGPFPFQFKTIPVQAGQTWYMRIEGLLSWSCTSKGACRGNTFVVAIVNRGQARTDMAPLGLSR